MTSGVSGERFKTRNSRRRCGFWLNGGGDGEDSGVKVTRLGSGTTTRGIGKVHLNMIVEIHKLL